MGSHVRNSRNSDPRNTPLVNNAGGNGAAYDSFGASDATTIQAMGFNRGGEFTAVCSDLKPDVNAILGPPHTDKPGI